MIELLWNFKISFVDAIKNLVPEASKTVKNIKSVYVIDMPVTVDNNQVVDYGVSTKACFSILQD